MMHLRKTSLNTIKRSINTTTNTIPLTILSRCYSNRINSNTNTNIIHRSINALYATSFTNVNTTTTNNTNNNNVTTFLRTFSSTKSYPEHIVLTMPSLSPTMERGNIAKWTVKVGDKIVPGQAMAEVETDKATVAFESVEEGYIAKILMGDGSADIVVGVPVAILAENKEDVPAFADYSVGSESKAAASTPKVEEASKKAESSSQQQPQAQQQPQQQQQQQTGGRIFASPAAKRVANEMNVSLSQIKGTGPNDRIVTADVREASAQPKQQPQQQATATPTTAAPAAPATGDYVDHTHSNIRKVIAQRLVQSTTTIPHYYLTTECKVDNLLKLRAQLNSKLTDSGVKISVNDLIVKAAALACRKIPAVNSAWMDNAIRQYNYVDVSVAVSTDNGLITPIIKDADIKGLSSIASETKVLAQKARANKLQPHEFQGGTFTISNLGMFGITEFSAIINPPQSAILAIGTAEKRVIPGKEEGQFEVGQFLKVTMSCDHRVFDGAIGAQWLQVFRGLMEDPNTMLL